MAPNLPYLYIILENKISIYVMPKTKELKLRLLHMPHPNGLSEFAAPKIQVAWFVAEKLQLCINFSQKHSSFMIFFSYLAHPI